MIEYEELRDSIRESSDNEVGVGASEEEIARAEETLEVRLPEVYRSFLRDFGWGSIRSSEVFGLGKNVPAWLDLVKITMSERSEVRVPLPHYLIPLLNDGGGNLYCLDTSKSAADPPVVFWDHGLPPTQTPDTVASAFTEWLADLIRRSAP